MVEEIFEVRIVEVGKMVNQFAQKQIRDKVSQKGMEFARNWKGYAKVVYATASPPKIVEIEPIEGTPVDYYKKIGMDAVEPVF